MIGFIQSFWLLIWDLALPLIGIMIIPIFLFHAVGALKEGFIRKKELIRQSAKIQEAKKDYENEIKISLSKKQVLAAIADIAKDRMVMCGTYNSDAGREMLLEYYQLFFEKLGFK